MYKRTKVRACKNSIKRYDKFRKTNNTEIFENYKHMRNKVTNEIRNSKKAEIDNLVENL